MRLIDADALKAYWECFSDPDLDYQYVLKEDIDAAPTISLKDIVYCRECDRRYEMLDGEWECMYHECQTIKPDDYCAWGVIGEGTKEKPRKPWTEEEREEFFKKYPRMMMSSATILTEESLEQLKALGLAVEWKGE